MPEPAKTVISLRLNGQETVLHADPRDKLVDVLREQARLTGTHVGCETGACGACHVLLEGDMIRACLILAVQADGLAVTTIEGLRDHPSQAALRDAFIARNALQCGFCTPGMLIAASALLAQNASPDHETIRQYIAGNICRCTGYHAIVEAVMDAAAALRKADQIGQ